MDIHIMPAINAGLNGICAGLLLIARGQIRQGKIQNHKRLMIAAFSVSVLFLISYLVYHAIVGSVSFQGQGWSRPLYFTILITHSILAAAVPVLATITLLFGLRSRFPKHRRVARWTYPIWLYVSFTGVIVYLMLYQLFPSA